MTSTIATRAMNAQNTGEVFLTLLQLSHPSFGATLRFVNDMADLTSNGHVYVGWPFDLPFPEIGSDNLPILELVIDNVDQSIWNAIKSISTPIDVQISWVLKSSPDTIEGGPLFLRMRSTEVGLIAVSGSLQFEDLLNEPYPFESYTPGSAPGLF